MSSRLDRIEKILEENQKGFKELKESQIKTDEQLNKTHEEIQELKESQVKTDEQLNKTHKELKESQVKTDEQLNKTHKEIQELKEVQKETSKAVKKVSRLFGISENKQAAIIEDVFHNSLIKTMTVNGVQYNYIDKNIKMKEGTKEIGELDIILYNGSTIALIEVKTKAHPNDLTLLYKLLENYRKKHPTDQRDIFLYYASFCFTSEIEQEASEKGIGLLTVQGDTIESLNDSLAAF